MLIVFLRTLILYGIVVIGMRIMGKRQLGELQPSELVITILISNIATLPIENTEVPLMSGAVPILTLMCFEVILSFFSVKSLKLRTFISGTPRIIIRDGKIDQKEMTTLRYSVEDLMEQLRVNSIFDIEEVDMAIVETTGQLSVCKKAARQPATVTDIGKETAPADIPAVVVSSGQIVTQGLQYCQLSEEELYQMMEKQGWKLPDIFLMTCTPNHVVVLIPKEQSHTKG